VIVDTFPVFDRIVMALLDLADRAYLTFENVVPTLLGAVKFIELLNSLSYAAERQRIVLNRYTTSSGNPSRRDVAERLGRSVDHVVPFDRRIVAAANSGKPFALRSTRWFATGRALNRLVVEVEELGLAEPTPKAV
jgi:pilus assembly protein CpaE